MARRWAEVITHVPCGGMWYTPPGRLLITAALENIDGPDGTLGSAGPSSDLTACLSISLLGAMPFDSDDIASMKPSGIFEGVILHDMGHVIGIGCVPIPVSYIYRLRVLQLLRPTYKSHYRKRPILRTIAPSRGQITEFPNSSFKLIKENKIK